MDPNECWRRFEEAARAALAGIGSVPRAYLAAVRRRFGDEIAARQEKELRAYIAHLREKGK
ncbi:hypothetical protein PTE31013_04649 [Pandoraea terrigena]|uniref:Uncharacterized protein n=1 Tax=Pandoraea terrigena TaxID=2508292 RepID=A0A5E4YP88_9BURK|nr:hypothetical protein PTE31013_04649 [Pandoraea terrigena]